MKKTICLTITLILVSLLVIPLAFAEINTSTEFVSSIENKPFKLTIAMMYTEDEKQKSLMFNKNNGFSREVIISLEKQEDYIDVMLKRLYKD